MTLIRLIFQRGIEISGSPHGISPTAAHFADAIQEIVGQRGLKPIVQTDRIDWKMQGLTDDESQGLADGELHQMLSANQEPSLDIRSNAAEQLSMSRLTDGFFGKCYDLSYSIRGTIYHCQRLANFYASISKAKWRLTKIPGFEHGPRGCIGNQTEAYYEFDALIAKARRTYDCLAAVLWFVFERHMSQCPGNFAKALAAYKSVPEDLRLRLKSSWDRFGSKLKDYRDCVMHYVPVDAHHGTAWTERLNCGVWSVMIRIPDNPEVRRRAKFTYQLNLDALDYGWELANELTEVIELVATAIKAKESLPTS